MEHYADIDVSLEKRAFALSMRPDGREAKVASEPEVLIGQFGGLTIVVARIWWRPGRCRTGCMRACGMLGCR